MKSVKDNFPNWIYTTVLLLLIINIISVLFYTGQIQAATCKEELKSKESLVFNRNIAVVGGIILMVLILFIFEPLPIGITAILIPVVLVSLRRWTGVSTNEALSGFSNNATITVMAMFVLSKGIQNSGAMQFIGYKIEKMAGSNEKKQMIAISGVTGGIASFINNTPTVAAFVPMVSNLARRTKVSPSKLMIPLSYASMLGGTMTLIGTSTNILASQISSRLINHPFSMFEFTKLGIVVLFFGILYLITIGYYLLPKRITYEEDLVQEYNMKDYLAKVKITEGFSLIGLNVGEILENFLNNDFTIVQIIRDSEKFMGALEVKSIRADDLLVIKTNHS
jgi:Na+/H+ antiporter NhaD/arsenite permease-like protein